LEYPILVVRHDDRHTPLHVDHQQWILHQPSPNRPVFTGKLHETEVMEEVCFLHVIRKEEHTGKLDKGKGVQEFTDLGACNDLHEDFDASSIEANLASYSDEGSGDEIGSEQDEEDREPMSIA